MNVALLEKTASSTRATFQDERIGEYALKGNTEAYAVRKNIKTWRQNVHRTGECKQC